MLLASFAAVVAVLIYLPSFWVRRVMRMYGGDSVDIPGTGAELARHLIDRFQLDGVAVEECAPFKDHFDPRGPAVRLSPQNYQGRSLTAVTGTDLSAAKQIFAGGFGSESLWNSNHVAHTICGDIPARPRSDGNHGWSVIVPAVRRCHGLSDHFARRMGC